MLEEKENKKDPNDYVVTSSSDQETPMIDLSKYNKERADALTRNTQRKLYEDSVFQGINSSAQSVQNPYAKMQSYGVNYGTTNKGGVNLERYYNRDDFKRLGFNPFADNESYYQANTGFWDDFRVARQQMGSLFNIGLWSYYSSEDDYTKAQRYATAANIGTSQREGTASRMFNNAVLNSGYTLGLMTSILAEEAALFLLTGGAGNIMKLPKTAYKVGESVKAFNQAEHIRRVHTALESLKNANEARNFWKAARGAGASMGKGLIPGYTTMDVLANWKRLGQVGKGGVLQPLDTGAKLTKLFGSFYRDGREILLVHDESKLESGMIYNDLMDEMILEYKNKNGRLPTDKEYLDFDKIAKAQERRTYLKNMGVIYLTNRISFGNAFNRMNPRLIRPGSKAIYQNKAGVIKADLSNNTAKPVFKEGFLNIKGAGKEAFRTVRNIKHTYKPMLKGLGRGAITYSRANFGEGLQEWFQETVQEAEKITGLDLYDRYKQGFRGAALDDALSTTSFFENYAEAAKHFWSAEGAEIFGIGFLMGGIAGPYMHMVSSTPNVLSELSEYRSKKTRQERKDTLLKARKSLEKKVEQFNKLTSKEQEHIYNYILQAGRQAAYRQQMDDAEEEGNNKKFYDVKNEALGDYILNALSAGTYDLFINSLEDMLDLSDEEFAEGFKKQLGFEDTEELTGLKQRAVDIIQSAKNIKTLYEEANNLFPEFVDVTEGELGELGDLTLQNLKTLRDDYIKMMVLNQHQLEQNLSRINKLFESLTGENNPFRDVKAIELSSISALLSPDLMKNEIDRLTSEEKTLQEIIKSDKEFDAPTKTKEKELKTIQNKLKRLKEINKAIENFISKTKYLNILEQQQKILKSQNPKLMVGQKVTIKVKGEKESKLGTVLNATLKDGKVVLDVEYLPEDSTEKKTSKLELTPENIEELNVDTSVDFAKLNDETDTALKEYLFFIARENNTSIDFGKSEAFVKAYLDANILKAEEQELSEQIMMMTSPGVFYDFMKKGVERRKKMNKFMKSSIKRDLKTYHEIAEKNALIQRLVEQHQAFLKADDLAAILELGSEARYRVFDVNTLEEIEPGTERHTDIVKEINEFIEDSKEAEETAKDTSTDIKDDTSDDTVKDDDPTKDDQEQYVELTIDMVKNTPLEDLPKTFVDILENLIEERGKQLEAEGLENTITIDTVQTDPLGMQLIANAIAEYKKQEGTIKPDTVKKGDSTSDIEAIKADIEKSRQEELFDILSEEDKQIALKIPEGDKRNKWVKTRVSKTTKGNDAIERHNAEDALNTSTDVATRIAAKRKLESNQPFNGGSISDINKVIFKIKNNDVLIGSEKLIKDYYDAELAALEEEQEEVEIEYESEYAPEDIGAIITLLFTSTPSKEEINFDTLTDFPEILKPDPATFYKRVLVSRDMLTQLSPNISANQAYLLHNKQKTKIVHVSATPVMQSDVLADPLSKGYTEKPIGLNTFEATVGDKTYYAPTKEMAEFLESDDPNAQLIEVMSLVDYAKVNTVNNVQTANKELNTKAEKLAKKITIDNYDEILTELNSFIPELQLKHKVEGSEINFEVAQKILENKYEELKTKVKPEQFEKGEFYKDTVTNNIYQVADKSEKGVTFTSENQTIIKQQNELWTMRKIDIDNYDGTVEPASEEVKQNAALSRDEQEIEEIKSSFDERMQKEASSSIEDIFNKESLKQDC